MCSNYDKSPFVAVEGYDGHACLGYEEVAKKLTNKLQGVGKSVWVLVIECYPGVNKKELEIELVERMNPTLLIDADDCSYSGETITNMIERELTDDRVFGVMTARTMGEFFCSIETEKKRRQIEALKEGMVLVYGVGASLITKGDILVYADMARWEIQMRYRRKELANWKMNNFEEEQLRKYKRAFFIEWRIADRLKKKIFSSIDYLLDTNKKQQPAMITKEALDAGLMKTSKQPFRLVPYFDPGVWGGQWMKDVCDLDKDKENFAWCFDCVPEENSLQLKFGEVMVEIPSINLVFFYPQSLLGEKVHARFGAEFPIRFDFLDTMGGQKLSMQVHPLTEYIQEKFGMHYTQDESYYILDAKEDAVVYLGLKKDINKEAMLNDLYEAQEGKKLFPDEKYINQFPAKKHDHFLIPAGTIHCSGSSCMVLEISATPYIFTFKLWDWNRLGLDGKPRPVHLDYGRDVIQWDRDTDWVKNNLVDQVTLIETYKDYIEEHTGLHEREFIETRRHRGIGKMHHNTNGGVNVLNLVEGREGIVESPNGKFLPFVVHYAETFIVPAKVGEYTISPWGESEGKEITTIKAYVR